jgi:hypothetical protein
LEDGKKQRRAREFEAAIDRLEREEYLASFPDNPNRIRDLERVRREKREVLDMMNEEFKMDEQYSKIADS